MVLQKKESESEHSDKEDTPPVTNISHDDHSNHVRQRVTNAKSSSPAAQEKHSKKVTEEESNSEHEDYNDDDDDEEKEWNELQKEMKQKKLAKVNYQSSSWPVHAPFFPEVSYHHGYWVYLWWELIRKNRRCGGFMCAIVRGKSW